MPARQALPLRAQRHRSVGTSPLNYLPIVTAIHPTPPRQPDGHPRGVWSLTSRGWGCSGFLTWAPFGTRGWCRHGGGVGHDSRGAHPPTAVAGIGHIAVNTADLGRFRRFHEGVLDVPLGVVMRMGHPPYLRHAMFHVAAGLVLHVFEVPGCRGWPCPRWPAASAAEPGDDAEAPDPGRASIHAPCAEGGREAHAVPTGTQGTPSGRSALHAFGGSGSGVASDLLSLTEITTASSSTPTSSSLVRDPLGVEDVSPARRARDQSADPLMLTIHVTPKRSSHMPNSSPHICFSIGTDTLPRSQSFSQ